MKHKVGPRVKKHIRAKPPSLNIQALRQAQAMEKPALGAISLGQHQYDAQEAQRETNAQGFAQALAEMLKSQGPATQTAYQNASGATAGFAKGFSDAEQHLADTENASLGSFLDKMGIPKAAADTALAKTGATTGGTSDVLYGLSGYQPASNLEREGAAFTAAANHLPAYAAGLGEENVNQLQNSAKEQDAQFEQQLAAERGKIPSLARQILNDMLSRQQQQESMDIQRAYLENSTRSAVANVTGVDPVTGTTKPGYYKDKSGHVLPDGYVMRHGHPVRLSTAQKKGAAGYDFNKELGSANDNIYSDAKGLVTTTKSTDPLAGLPGHPATVVQKPSYAQAARQLFNEYKYLLRQVPRGKRPKAKRLLNQTIREALAAAGITPSVEPPQVLEPTHPGPNA